MATVEHEQPASNFETRGYAIIADAVPLTTCDRLLDIVDAREHSGADATLLRDLT